MIVNANALQIPLADQSVHCIVTSPPYWGLRNYGVSGQLGLERTPDCGAWPRGKHEPYIEYDEDNEPFIRWRRTERIVLCGECYVCRMVQVFRECWRVLRDDGTLWLNIGDSYASQPAGNITPSGFSQTSGKRNGKLKEYNTQSKSFDGLKPKDLVGIPWRLAFALQADGWYLRSDIIWSKPNPMPESVTDRPTKSHEYLFLLAKRERYYYDVEAIREPVQDVTIARLGQPNFDNQEGGDKDPKTGNRSERRTLENLKEKYTKQGVWEDRFTGYELWKEKGIGRNRRTVWTIPTAPYKGAHFATFPPALVEPCIKAGTSERGVCPKCGRGWVRVVERINESTWQKRKELGATGGAMNEGPRQQVGLVRTGDLQSLPTKEINTLGWQPACNCSSAYDGMWMPHDDPGYVPYEPIPALVFDPFVGSGTTVKVAYDLGRRGVGLDLSLDYLDRQATIRIHNGHVGRLI